LKISVIDLGFNSVKLVNYYVNDNNNSFKAYEQRGVKAKLGEGLYETGELGGESIERTINALKLFRDIISLQSIKCVLPVATSAVREAKNKENFLKQVYKRTGFQFKVLTGKEEALCSYAGALNSTCVPTSLFFDLGGGSLEIVYTENFVLKKLISLPLGALRLSQVYSQKRVYGDGDGLPRFSKKNYDELNRYVFDAIPDKKELDMSPDTRLVGVGGTLRAMASYNQEIQNYLLQKIHNYQMKYDSVDSISKSLYRMTPYEIASIDAIGGNRAETITAGSSIINNLMLKLGFDKVVVSAQGLREGILSTFLEFLKVRSGADISQHKIQSYVKFNCKRELAPEHARSFIGSLFSLGLIKEREHEILAHAIRQMSEIPYTTNLHNIFYMIIDEDNRFLTHREQLVLAIAIIHTKKEKVADRLFSRYRSMMQSQNRKSIKKISVCIIISNILERIKAKAKLRIHNDNKLVLKISLEKNRTEFPRILVENALKNFGTAFEIPLDYSIHYNSSTSNMIQRAL
jgi:exopolyphosphatase / guanosine-5'-triphosphate,3'-diphosphate pyrophosphatase